MGALAVVLAIALAGCSGAAQSQDLDPLRSLAGDGPAARPSVRARPGVDPCALITAAEVEAALSVTITSARRQPDDPLARALSFALPGQVCEYHGAPAQTGTPAPTAAPAKDTTQDTAPAGRATRPGLPSGSAVADALEELSESAGGPTPAMAARLDTLELSVSVNDQPLSRDEFDMLYERRAVALDPYAAVATEGVDIADPVEGPASDFVEQATDGAKDVGGVGDAARWYPATAQLDVLVGDVAFAVTSLKQSPMMADTIFGARVEPAVDPPPEFVEIARLAAERL